MDTEKQFAVRITMSAVPEFLALVQRLADRLAENREFAESQRLQLKQGIQQACRHLTAEPGDAAELSVDISGYPDRVEIMMETQTGLETSEADLYLLNELLDRVALEENEGGRLRLTLVQYQAAPGRKS